MPATRWFAPPILDPAWHPDPAARFELRYWDGTSWTEHVSTGGIQNTDMGIYFSRRVDDDGREV